MLSTMGSVACLTRRNANRNVLYLHIYMRIYIYIVLDYLKSSARLNICPTKILFAQSRSVIQLPYADFNNNFCVCKRILGQVYLDKAYRMALFCLSCTAALRNVRK